MTKFGGPWLKYVLWAIGAIVFVVWGGVAMLCPEIPLNYSKKRAAEAGIPWPFDEWMSSRWFRVQFWIGGAIALLTGAALLWLLWRDL